MKILLSNPPWWENSPNRTPHARREHGLRYGIRAGSRWPFTAQAHCAPDAFSFGGYLPFPFFMGYAASYVQRAFPQAQVVFRDSIALRESYQSFFSFAQQLRPDFILVESATPSWDHDCKVLRNLAALLPGVRLLVAGTITSTRAAEALAVPGVVAAIQGEYEKGTVRVLREYENRTLRAMRNEVGTVGHDLLTKEEMNAAPFPLYPEETWDHYWDACPAGNRPKQLQVWSSRGCPFRCCFCAWPAVMTGNDPTGDGKRTVRTYSPEYMRAFLREETQHHSYASIYDDSDTFNLVQRHTVEMCEVYRDIGLPWSAMCRADTIDRPTWQLMKDSGCHGVKIGFESGVQRVIDEIVNKKLDLAKARETAIWLRSIGLTVHGTFTVGLPGERPDEARATEQFIADLYRDGGLDTHQLSGTALIEGTPLDRIEHGAALKAYPEARVDENYHSSRDGQKKIEGVE